MRTTRKNGGTEMEAVTAQLSSGETDGDLEQTDREEEQKDREKDEAEEHEEEEEEEEEGDYYEMVQDDGDGEPNINQKPKVEKWRWKQLASSGAEWRKHFNAHPWRRTDTCIRTGRKKGSRKEYHYKLFKTPKEALVAVAIASEKKIMMPVDKYFILSWMAGVYVSFGGLFAFTVGKGMPSADPGFAQLLYGFGISFGLVLIVFLGAELYTSNLMYMTVGLLNHNITFKAYVFGLGVPFFGNFSGCLSAAYFLGYLTEFFSNEPYNSALLAFTEQKVSFNFGVVLLRAIGAGWLVCAANYIALSAEDVVSKFAGIIFPLSVFAAIGFEHCVANMFFVPMGIFYGADVTFGQFIYASLIPSAIGNAIGGAVLCGSALWYLYAFHEVNMRSTHGRHDVHIGHIAFIDYFICTMKGWVSGQQMKAEQKKLAKSS